jgi:hypothetical protein
VGERRRRVGGGGREREITRERKQGTVGIRGLIMAQDYYFVHLLQHY